MPRADDVPNCPAKPSPTSADKRNFDIELITPMFGGGAEAGVTDPATLIRGKSIRGQLRFWWRATRGAAFASAAELWRREEEIFGSTDFPSPLDIQVSAVKPSEVVSSHEVIPLASPAAYALFPAIQKENLLMAEGISFQLKLSWPGTERLVEQRRRQNERRKAARQPELPPAIKDISPDIDAALWGWVNFGGLGSRTRRGCGALSARLIDAKKAELVPASATAVKDWWKRAATALSLPVSGRAWPMLSADPARLLCHSTAEDGIAAWKKGLQLLRQFRQGPGLGRDPGRGARPGRSRFPEPESVRRATRRRSAKHPRLEDVPDQAFPRAEFGLPIIFHFMRGDTGEPPDTALLPRVNGEQEKRMASPLIVKPLALADGKCVPIILHLLTPELTEVDLTDSNNSDRSHGVFGPAAIRNPAFATYPNSPLKPSRRGSAIEAFLAYARTQGFS